MFNYRIGEATAGIVVAPKRKLPDGGILEVTLQNPSGGTPFLMKKQVTPNTKRYSFSTPPLSGVKADTDYLVTAHLLDADGKEIDKAEKTLRSDLDQTVSPERAAHCRSWLHT